MLTLRAATAAAQGSVSGQLSIIERAGAQPSDLRSTVVYLESPGRTLSVPAAASETTIAMTGREFVPHVRVVMVGSSVRFPNDDPFSHNVFSNAQAGPFDLGLYRRGTSRSATFPRAGVYPTYCNIHSRMAAYVLAVTTPYVAFASADGRFTFESVPPGSYLLRAWHEHAGTTTGITILVPSSGITAQRLVLDARSFVAAPHLNKFGVPYAATRADHY
jgi:plastocyanin